MLELKSKTGKEVTIFTREETRTEKFWQRENYIIIQEDRTYSAYVHIYDQTFSETFNTMTEAMLYCLKYGN